MATIAWCPRGGQQGLMVTTEELRKLSKELKSDFIDEFVPVPNRQPTCGNIDEDHSKNRIYWETETGKHGWACDKCGAVMQWG